MVDLWKKLAGELIDIIEWLDDSNNTLVYRFERMNNEIKYGAKLTVREGQMAVFINEGQMADVFKPGMYTLTTQNLPILATLKGWKYGFESPFKAEVYFVSTRKFTDLKWGTPGPATMRDKEFGIVRATAFGIYAIRVKDPGIFIKDISGTEGRFTTDQIQENLRGKIGLRIKEVMPELGLSIIDLEAKVSTMGQMLRERISPDFETMGLELVEVQVQDVGLPEEVEKAIDKRGAIAAVGNLQAYTQYETASAIKDAATTPNSAAGAGMGLGAGFAMGGAMAGPMGGAMAAGAAGMTPGGGMGGAAMPPPLPSAVAFHVAINGQQAGPFDMTALQAHLTSGTLKRDSLVWKAGMAAWAQAGTVPELAALFANMPPPIPPAA
ncbi:MAG: SPFH domain-containing protein [Betaproteobacteria bacterium]|nr:SPFH domain-containing protein [Betaproteobacteria bacterium]